MGGSAVCPAFRPGGANVVGAVAAEVVVDVVIDVVGGLVPCAVGYCDGAYGAAGAVEASQFWVAYVGEVVVGVAFPWTAPG